MRLFAVDWRFSKWAKRPVYTVEYFGAPGVHDSSKRGHFSTKFDHEDSCRCYHCEILVMYWHPALYSRGDHLPIEAHSARQALREFKKLSMFRQHPYLEYRVVEKQPGVLKSAQRQAQLEQQHEARMNYRNSYIEFLAKELGKQKDML